jgi:multidrug efflux pump subunit AcrA (membrane-fusion protein)
MIIFLAWILAIATSVSNIHPTIISVHAENNSSYQAKLQTEPKNLNLDKQLDLRYYQTVAKPQILQLQEQEKQRQLEAQKVEAQRLAQEQAQIALQKQQAELARQRQLATQQAAQVKVIQTNAPSNAGASIDAIKNWCANYGCDPKMVVGTAFCETGNRNITSYSGGHFGPFQFASSTFYNYAKRLGIGGADIWNTDQQAQVASYIFSLSGGDWPRSHWPNYTGKSCYNQGIGYFF